ncbi:MAG: nucleotide exchange factor GrpE [Bdellovibrionales bacterium]|nr:nucleotide exchange factor GrpE [Bdellovibrionales bacterium]NQZ19585.1 nucleotide exchange factor GrpE [Bdellovibrionales bacterium]
MSESKKDASENQENKAVKEDIEDVSADTPEVEAPAEASPEDKVASLEKDYLYLRAEFENYKRQAIKERSQLLKFGAERLAFDLLDTIDVFQSAMAGEVTAENYVDFVKGIEMTAQSLRTTLEKHGIKEVECKGQPFDPNTQEALSSEPNDDLPEGHVTQVFKAPYKYHDKLLRAGQVVVSSSKSE